MIALAVVTAVLLGAAAALMITMVRRDEPILGLAALGVCLLAAVPAVLYAGLDSA